MTVTTVLLQHGPQMGIMVLSVLCAVVGNAGTRSTRAEAALNRRDSDHHQHPSSIIIRPPPPLPHIGTTSSSSSATTTKHFSNTTGGGGPYSNNSDRSNCSSSSSDSKGKTVALAVVDVAISVGFCALVTHLANKLLKSLQQNGNTRGDPDDGSVNRQAVHKSLRWIIDKRGGGGAVNNGGGGKTNGPTTAFTLPPLTHREWQMAEEIVNPDDITDASFAQIGGLDQIKQEIYDLAVYPLLHPHFYSTSKLRQPPRGILLYGKPGTGKTMLAKAIAKEAAAVFLPLQLSKILNKYWGESNKLIAATFSLAHKLAPAVIFIDELDTFLKNSNSETAYMDSIKAEFLTLWDGVGTATNARVLVLGATNKPHQIDPAIARRMPRTFEVPLPDVTGRLSILQLILKEEDLDEEARRYLPQLARMTAGYSGSDLKELCRAAAMVPVQERTAEFSRRRVMGESSVTTNTTTTTTTTTTTEIGDNDDEEAPLRPMSVRDLDLGRAKVKRSGEAAQHYGVANNNGSDHGQNGNNNGAIRMDELTMRQLMALLQAFAKGGAAAPPPPTSPPNDDRIPNM